MDQMPSTASDEAGAMSSRRSRRSMLPGLLDPRPGFDTTRAPVEAADDAVARGLAMARVYAFASVD